MSVDSFVYFLKVAETKSFALAARNLFISPQALNKSIKRLEDKYDVKFFERTGKQLRLTDAGRHLVPFAEALVQAHDDLEVSMTAFTRTKKRDPRMTLLAMPFNVSLLKTIENDLGSVGTENATIIEESFDRILEKVGSGDPATPLGFVVIPQDRAHLVGNRENVLFTPLIESYLIVKGTKKLLSPRKKFITKEELCSLPIVYFREDVLEHLVQTASSSKPLCNVILQTHNIEIREELVANGSSVTFYDTFNAFLASSTDGFLYIPIEDSPSFFIGFVQSKTAPLPKEHQLFVDDFTHLVSTAYTRYFSKFPLNEMS